MRNVMILRVRETSNGMIIVVQRYDDANEIM